MHDGASDTDQKGILMRKKLIAGNWKMNLTPSASEKLAKELVTAASGKDKADIMISPAFTSLDRVSGITAGTNVKLGAQDMHWEDQGAYTGKISWDMLKDLKVEYVILGHSEQRTYFHETNKTVNLKTKKAISAGLIPVVCVGETLEERETGRTESVVEDHVRGAFDGISKEDAVKCVIAYEPVWAIGTGKNATPEQAQDVHAFIRKLLASVYDQGAADVIRILYGGSMKPDNAEGLLSKPDIDGGLIGGASLKADSFIGIADAVK